MEQVLAFWPFAVTLLGAIACARSSVLVVTPFFLPDASLIAALNVECHYRELATLMTDLARSKIQQSRSLSTAEIDGQSLPIRLRDGVARLFSPYL